MAKTADTNPVDLYEHIKEAYLRYYDSAYELRDPGLMAERRALMLDEGNLFREPLIEPIPRYGSDFDLYDLIGLGGLDKDCIDVLYDALFPFANRHPGNPPMVRAHQGEALKTAFSNGAKRNPIVTSGTGSGKTESFLLPVLARLLIESRSWPDPEAQPTQRWWQNPIGATDWVPQRATNALVEDQITRLRRALDPEGAMNGRIGQNRLYFGRYTGATPGLGEPPIGKQQAQQARRASASGPLRQIRLEHEAILARIAKGKDPDDLDLRFEFPDVDGTEILMRWDMLAQPPDILITNYSMLNVIMMREREEVIFQSTRDWLKDPSNVFTLVVDELHNYRGTSGTEVALVVRKLLDRLSLNPDSPQLRCIATSASLDEGNEAFAERFFSQSRESFQIIPGTPERLSPKRILDISRYSSVLDDVSNGICNPQDFHDILKNDRAIEALASACTDDDGTMKPTSIGAVAATLFGGDQAAHRELDAILGALPELGLSDSFRFHMFLRNVRGLWACSDPGCSAVDTQYKFDSRTVGRLFTAPRYTCFCGGRVLELTYCLRCGEIFLGGFASGDG